MDLHGAWSSPVALVEMDAEEPSVLRLTAMPRTRPLARVAAWIDIGFSESTVQFSGDPRTEASKRCAYRLQVTRASFKVADIDTAKALGPYPAASFYLSRAMKDTNKLNPLVRGAQA